LQQGDKDNLPADDPETKKFEGGYKVIVKPTQSFMSKGVKMCASRQCMDDQIALIFKENHKEVLVEEYSKTLNDRDDPKQ
jgi:glutathione synthase/RimK-type ligase-like ATP-grasp enzyme